METLPTSRDYIIIFDDEFREEHSRDALEGSGTELVIGESAENLTVVFKTVKAPIVVEVRLSVANVMNVTMKFFVKTTDSQPILEVRSFL